MGKPVIGRGIVNLRKVPKASGNAPKADDPPWWQVSLLERFQNCYHAVHFHGDHVFNLFDGLATQRTADVDPRCVNYHINPAADFPRLLYGSVNRLTVPYIHRSEDHFGAERLEF